MKIRYPGPSVAVDLLGPDGNTLRVARGEVIDVPDDYAAQLLVQGWPAVDREAAAEPHLLAAIPRLSHAAAAALVSAGYEKPADIAGASDDDLLAVDGIGPATLATIRAAVPAKNGDD